MTRLGMLACAASLWTTTASAATLAERLGSLIAAHDGQVAVVVKHLGTGETFAHNADVPMATASLIKFPVMVEAYRQAGEGKVDLKAMITLKDADKVPGSGILTIQFTEGMTLSLRDAIRLMIAYSDNTATNMVVDKIGLPATTAYMESLSLKHTRLHSKVYRRDTSIAPERSKEFGLGSTSAGEMLDLLERLHRRELVSRDASEAMFEHMLRCEDKSTISRYLPHGTKVAQKTGAVSDVRTSAGIILSPSGPIAICVLTSKNKDQSWTPDNAAEIFIAEVAREAYNHFQKAEDLKGAVVPDESALRIGSTGPRVEKLQRILNAKMTPSPGLSVDGDFGPGTEAAVLDYQKKNNLTANGVVGPEMWKALGEGPPPSGSGVPAPEVVNADRQPREAADPLDGMPWTTAKAWVAVDGRNGEVLGGKNDFAPLDMASTTKIMTALMVLRLAGKEPGVLDEVVTFSSRADQTVGSTSDVHSGERVTVRELLYGLLLPSGNDASVALASWIPWPPSSAR
jgi:D-alanyl-D-alanine carboxypeptidase